MVVRLLSVALTLASLTCATSPFNGTWVRDPAVSAPVGGKIGGPGRPVEGVALVIDDSDGTFQLTRRVSLGGEQAATLVQKFRLDGQETVNPAPAPGGRGEVRSKAKRDGAPVVVDGVQQITALNGGIQLKTTDIYEVSDDGKTLTITSTRNNGMGSQTGPTNLS